MAGPTDFISTLASAAETTNTAVEVGKNVAEKGTEFVQSIKETAENFLGTAKKITESAAASCKNYAGKVREGLALHFGGEHAEELNQRLGEIDERIREAGESFKQKVEGLFGKSSEKATGNKKAPNTIKAEVVYTNGEWLAEDIDSNTKEWLLGHKGYEKVAEDFTPGEREKAQKYARVVYSDAKENPAKHPDEKGTNLADSLEKVESDEDAKEALKLMIRIAVKLGTAVAEYVCETLANDETNPEEFRKMFNFFAESFEEADKLFEHVATGENRPNLGRDVALFIAGKISRKGGGSANKPKNEEPM